MGAGAGTHSQTQEVGEARTWLVRHPTEWRQVGIVALYQSLLMAMMFVPAARHPLVLIPAGMLSFLNAVVIHNHLHRGIFHSHRLNMIWRCVLSFGALYPASANVPSHNLVHHHFGDDGQPDWAEPQQVRFRPAAPASAPSPRRPPPPRPCRAADYRWPAAPRSAAAAPGTR